MRIIYMATAEIAVPVLVALHNHSDHELVAVFSQPDRPQGRKRKILPSPVKAAALELDIPVHTPEKVGEAEALMKELKPDLSIVFAYGQYIPSKITELPMHGSINLHPSMLPAYRGAAPIQWAIADGLEETGISVIRLAKKMDAGDIVCQRSVAIDPEDTNATLSATMSIEASEIILEAIELVADPDFAPQPQDDDAATEARKLDKADRELDWARPAAELRNWVRACQPWPGNTVTWSHAAEPVEVKVHRVELEDDLPNAKPGTQGERDGVPVVQCGKGALRLVDVQPAGRKVMSGEAFLRGLPK